QHPPPTRLSTLPLHDALPIWPRCGNVALEQGTGSAAHRDAPLRFSTWGVPKAPLIVLCSARAGLQCAQVRQRPAEPLGDVGPARSEEHTSELQSRENLVCRLL